MRLLKIGQVIFLCAFATAACSRTGDESARDGVAGYGAEDRSEASAKPISLTGCLQRGDGRSYVLTGVNEPSRPSVGTSGPPEAVQREQLRQATHAYRIEAKGDVELEGMVGKQVSISGTLRESADLPLMSGSGGSDAQTHGGASADNRKPADGGMMGRSDDRSGLDIDHKDLAQVDATSVSVVAEQCGSEATGTSGSDESKRR